MFNAIKGVKYHALCYIWSEALCSFLCMELSYVLIALHGVKLYAHCYTWSEAICSFIYIQ